MRAIATRGPTRSSSGSVSSSSLQRRPWPRRHPPRRPRRVRTVPEQNPIVEGQNITVTLRDLNGGKGEPKTVPGVTLTVYADSKDGDVIGTQVTDSQGSGEHRDPRATASTSSCSIRTRCPSGRQAQRQGRDRQDHHSSPRWQQLRAVPDRRCAGHRSIVHQQAHRLDDVRAQIRFDHRASRSRTLAHLRHDRLDQLRPRRADHLWRHRYLLPQPQRRAFGYRSRRLAVVLLRSLALPKTANCGDRCAIEVPV